jgi:hypothetical protein
VTGKAKPHTDVIEAGIQALVSNASRLGITWKLSYATTDDSQTSAVSWTVIMDGDDSATPIAAVSLIGFAPNGSRVAIISLSTGGNYAIGLIGVNPLPNVEGYNAALGTDSTSSGSYANFASVSLDFVKQSSLTRVRVDLATAMFSSATSTKVRMGIQFGSTDYDIINYFISQANVVVPVVGNVLLSGIGAGSYTATLRWLRVSGTGVLNVSSAEDVAVILTEVN